MVPKVDFSTKRVAISKANAQMVGIVAAATFVTIFCLMASRAVLSQNLYLGRVVSAKRHAVNDLLKDIKNYDTLKTAYNTFDNQQVNIIGGNRTGTGDNDGSNSKIILDALPSTYDFPALTSSLEKILKDNGVSNGSISGTDDQIAQQTNASSPSPESITMPFTLNATKLDYPGLQKFVGALDHSIRPIQVDTMDISGGGSDISLSVSAHTYYQPAKNVNITTKVQK
jgi:hypothetical protein